MPVNTITVGAAVTGTVMRTYITHYLNRRPLHQKPTAHISYHEGLELIRQFLHYASFHTVEELQAFTQQWVPVPHWVHVDRLQIPNSQLVRAANYVRAQLGPDGVKAVGGPTWWQWRRDDGTLKAEWIEMRKDMEDRKRSPSVKGQRIMLYVHGGAYFFGSVDEHRYQMQRHARKLKARVLAPRYRLAPQFPFPCGLMDCLATYLYLLEQDHDPNTIILAGDSAGGGMVLSILVILRDQGIPLPAGAVLLSPWVDLTHSFPSLSGNGKMDYIPAHGFIHKPSMSWPPPNADDLMAYERGSQSTQQANGPSPQSLSSRPSRYERKEERAVQKEEKADRVRGFSVSTSDQPEASTHLKPPGKENAAEEVFVSRDGKYSIGPKSILSLQLEDTRVEIKDQIQLYAPNHMLTHPLVSPALQPSLGGLPPLLIQVGGGELLRDEQIYIAHKAALPLAYLPPPSNHQTADTIQVEAPRHKPTNVQLQVWDDLCHVAPTLSFTRPAKHMYRSVAQFGAWALARAQKTTIDIMDDDSISIVSGDSSSTESERVPSADDIKLTMPQSARHVGFESIGTKEERGVRVGKAGDPLPAFDHRMIRQRIDRHGRIYALPPPTELVALNLPSSEIGVPKPGPVNKWMKAQQKWNGKFAKQKLKVQKKRMKDLEKGYEGFPGETPPPTALAGRRVKGMKKEKKAKRSWGMSMWSGWGSKHDEDTITREGKADQNLQQGNSAPTFQQPDQSSTDGAIEAKPPTADRQPPKSRRRSVKHRPSGLNPISPTSRSRSRSHHSAVADKGQISTSLEELNKLAPPTPTLAEATVLAPERSASALPSPTSGSNVLGAPNPNIIVSADGEAERPKTPETLIPATETLSTRPTRGRVAYPFKLKVDGDEGDVNASTLTLQSVQVASPGAEEFGLGNKEMRNGLTENTTKVEEGERPPMERFVTAAVGASKSERQEKKDDGDDIRTKRPEFERFETAQEDLNAFANQKA